MGLDSVRASADRDEPHEAENGGDNTLGQDHGVRHTRQVSSPWAGWETGDSITRYNAIRVRRKQAPKPRHLVSLRRLNERSRGIDARTRVALGRRVLAAPRIESSLTTRDNLH
jgi:hypothetical protein